MATAPRPPRPLLPLALLMGAGGLIAMIVGWIKVSASTEVERQIEWSALSLFGAVLVCAAFGLAATSGERMFMLRLQRLGTALAVDLAGPRAEAPGMPADRLVAAPTMARFHRPDCPLVHGKAVAPDTRASHERAGRQACGVCGA